MLAWVGLGKITLSMALNAFCGYEGDKNQALFCNLLLENSVGGKEATKHFWFEV